MRRDSLVRAGVTDSAKTGVKASALAMEKNILGMKTLYRIAGVSAPAVPANRFEVCAATNAPLMWTGGTQEE